MRTAASNLSSLVFGKFLICNILDSHCGNAQFSPAFPHSFQLVSNFVLPQASI